VSWYLMGDKTHRFVCRLQIHVTPTDGNSMKRLSTV